jgi:hypothetical protein
MPKQQMSVLCTKASGKLKIFDVAAYAREFAQFGDGEDLELHIETIGRTRTHAQNRFFHGPILNAFADPYGGRVRAKTELCLLFLPVEHVRPDGSVVIVPGHTSTLTVKEFNDFIDECLLLAAENDIPIADAEDWRRNRGKAA